MSGPFGIGLLASILIALFLILNELERIRKAIEKQKEEERE